MNKSVVQLPNLAGVAGQSQVIAVKRVRFQTEAAPGIKARRAFVQPRPCFAVDEVVELADIPRQQPWPEPTDELVVVMVAGAASAETKRFSQNLLAKPDRPEAVSTTAFALNGQSIQWRPGFALVQGPSIDGLEGVVDALTEFAFYEGELRRLERALDSREVEAQADVVRAHRIRLRDRHHWRRIGETIENLYQMRLTYARLESQVAQASRSLARDARQVMTRLLTEAEVDARLEAASNRLEAFEDLYEGANDRIADYRWYLSSEWLEVGIIFLLVVEVALLGFEIYRHLK
jgi:hypothetical protein